MRPMISSNSPFRRLPVNLPRRQILYFDALRLSAEMAGPAFERLYDLLMLVSKQSGGDPPADKAVRALSDAYCVIDSAHRFREILQTTPRLKHNAVFELFIRQTQDVKKLRNVVQHLNRNVDRIAQEGWAALGNLTWLGPSVVRGGPPTSWIIQAGTSYPGQITHGPMIDFQSSIPPGEIVDISLATAGVRVNLTTLVGRLRSIIKNLEVPLKKLAADKKHFRSDGIYMFALAPVQEETQNTRSDKGAV